MSSIDSRDDKISVVNELEPSRESIEGTGDRLNEAAKFFVALCDATPIFMTCEIGERGSMVVLKCCDLNQAQNIHNAIIEIAAAVHQS